MGSGRRLTSGSAALAPGWTIFISHFPFLPTRVSTSGRCSGIACSVPGKVDGRSWFTDAHISTAPWRSQTRLYGQKNALMWQKTTSSICCPGFCHITAKKTSWTLSHGRHGEKTQHGCHLLLFCSAGVCFGSYNKTKCWIFWAEAPCLFLTGDQNSWPPRRTTPISFWWVIRISSSVN